jgi:transitional endoplasmic reticulum ATPase
VTVLAATNRPDIIDPALLRAGRFELQLALPVPDERARREILAIHTRGKPLAEEVELDRLAAATEGWVGARLEALCRRAAMFAIQEFVRNDVPGSPPQDVSSLIVSARHFERAMDEAGKRPA